MARHVVVGASLAGATAAITLREHSADADVTLIGAEAGPPYERPPLSKAYLRGDAPFEKALVRPTGFYAEHGIETMLGTAVAYDEIPWFWSDQYDATVQYAGHHTAWEQLVVRGRPDSDSYLACYVNDGRIDAAVGFNRAKDLRRIMPLIKSRRAVDLERLRDEAVDLRSLST